MRHYDLTDFEWSVVEPLMPLDRRGPKPQHCRKTRYRWTKALYREQYRLERFFDMLKNSRRIANRYDGPGASFFAVIQLASIRIFLRSIEPTAWSMVGSDAPDVPASKRIRGSRREATACIDRPTTGRVHPTSTRCARRPIRGSRSPAMR